MTRRWQYYHAPETPWSGVLHAPDGTISKAIFLTPEEAKRIAKRKGEAA
jgi:hypothetical protein